MNSSIPHRHLYPSTCVLEWKSVRKEATLELSHATILTFPEPITLQLPHAIEFALLHASAATADIQEFSRTLKTNDLEQYTVLVKRRFVVDRWGDLKLFETQNHPNWLLKSTYQLGSTH